MHVEKPTLINILLNAVLLFFHINCITFLGICSFKFYKTSVSFRNVYCKYIFNDVSLISIDIKYFMKREISFVKLDLQGKLFY